MIDYETEKEQINNRRSVEFIQEIGYMSLIDTYVYISLLTSQAVTVKKNKKE